MFRLEWSDLSEAKADPGVYAWYYTPRISSFDLEQVTDRVRSAGDTESAHLIVKTFLERYVFRPFAETPYDVCFSGPLKAEYSGTAEHQPRISKSLIERLTADPERLRYVSEALATAAPELSCPLYIGMAKNLRSRLAQHKSLIEKYQNSESYQKAVGGDLESLERDHSFAEEVVRREIFPSHLFVCVRYIETESNHYVDLENVFNRIFFPLFGRN